MRQWILKVVQENLVPKSHHSIIWYTHYPGTFFFLEIRGICKILQLILIEYRWYLWVPCRRTIHTPLWRLIQHLLMLTRASILSASQYFRFLYEPGGKHVLFQKIQIVYLWVSQSWGIWVGRNSNKLEYLLLNTNF